MTIQLTTAASIDRIQPDFFANSGVYIDNRCEVQIFDTAALQDTITNGRSVLIDGVSKTLNAAIVGANVVVSTPPAAILGQAYNAIPISKLITGIPYGDQENTYTNFNSAPQTDGGKMVIEGARTNPHSVTYELDGETITHTVYDYLLTITVGEGDPVSYTVANGTGSGANDNREVTGKLHLQSHWGGGVRFTKATVIDTSTP